MATGYYLLGVLGCAVLLALLVWPLPPRLLTARGLSRWETWPPLL